MHRLRVFVRASAIGRKASLCSNPTPPPPLDTQTVHVLGTLRRPQSLPGSCRACSWAAVSARRHCSALIPPSPTSTTAATEQPTSRCTPELLCERKVSSLSATRKPRNPAQGCLSLLALSTCPVPHLPILTTAPTQRKSLLPHATQNPGSPSRCRPGTGNSWSWSRCASWRPPDWLRW